MQSKSNGSQLIKLLDVYSDCWACAAVIKDPGLLKSDPLNPRMFKALCPSCKNETRRLPFPESSIRSVFEMIAECADMSKPILVLILVRTTYETMVENFVYRLLERSHCPDDICDSVINSTEHRGKASMIENLTGAKIGKLAKEMKFKTYFKTLEYINHKRNSFLHTGKVHKTGVKKIGELSYPGKVELDMDDIRTALGFAKDTIHFFAKLYTKFGEWAPIESPWFDEH